MSMRLELKSKMSYRAVELDSAGHRGVHCSVDGGSQLFDAGCVSTGHPDLLVADSLGRDTRSPFRHDLEIMRGPFNLIQRGLDRRYLSPSPLDDLRARQRTRKLLRSCTRFSTGSLHSVVA